MDTTYSEEDDVSPELYEAIKSRIRKGVTSNAKIQTILKRIERGTATHADTETYSLELGKITSKAFKAVLVAEALPEGRLFYHIAAGTVGKALIDNLANVNSVGGMIQEGLNRGAGLGMKSVNAKLNADRIQGLVSNMANCEELERARELMEEPVINTTQSYADELIEANADFQKEAGLQSVIVRTADPNCCDWCAEVEGTWDDWDDREVFRRHEFCRCVVTYIPDAGKSGYQNVYSKKWTTDPQLVQERVRVGLSQETRSAWDWR